MTRVSLLAALFFPALAFAEDAATLLEKGIYAEETLGDLDRAIEAYQRVLAEHAAQRAAAAEAEFRLAMCRVKKGEEDQAVSGLEKIIALYPEQKTVAGQARDELAKLRPRSQALPTGAELRRTVLDEKEEKECYLDLDTGRILDPGSRRALRQAAEWRRATGADVVGDASIAGVVGFDMAVRRVDPSAWESPPEQLLQDLKRARGAVRAPLGGAGGMPATYLFRTREGSIGLLEVLGVNNAPPAKVEIRFRLLSQGLAAGGADDPQERASRLLAQIKGSFFQAAVAVKAGDSAAARKAMEVVMPTVRELEKLIEGTPASKTIGLAIRQLERFDEAVREGHLDRAAGIFEALDAVGPALEQVIVNLGNGEDGATVKGRVAFRLVATEEDGGPADELVDPADSTGKAPKVRVLEEVIADNAAIESAEVREAAGGSGWEISLSLSEEGAKTLSDASAKFVGRRLAIVVDGRLVSAPLIRDRVGKEVVISGKFAYGEAALLARALAPRAGGSNEIKKR